MSWLTVDPFLTVSSMLITKTYLFVLRTISWYLQNKQRKKTIYKVHASTSFLSLIEALWDKMVNSWWLLAYRNIYQKKKKKRKRRIHQTPLTVHFVMMRESARLRPKKIPVFPLTCRKKIRVGRSENLFIFLSKFCLLEMDKTCLLGLNIINRTWKHTYNAV